MDRARFKQAAASAFAWTQRGRVGRILVTTVAVLMVVGLVSFSWIWFAPCWLGGCAPVSELSEFQAEGSQLLDINDQPIGTLATVAAAVALVRPQPDEKVLKLVRTWAANFDTARALAMGFRADPDFATIVRAYIEDNPTSIKLPGVRRSA